MPKPTKDSKKWKLATDREHNIDPRIAEIVRLLARIAAEEDFQASLDMHSPEKEAKDEKPNQ